MHANTFQSRHGMFAYIQKMPTAQVAMSQNKFLSVYHYVIMWWWSTTFLNRYHLWKYRSGKIVSTLCEACIPAYNTTCIENTPNAIKYALIARCMGQYGSHLGPTAPRWAPHVGPMNLAIWDNYITQWLENGKPMCILWAVAVLGWGLLSQFPPFRYFPNFSASLRYMLATVYHVHIWQVLPQLSCDDTCQIWMWCK